MSEREAVEKVISRMYKHHLKSTGRLPRDQELRDMEGKAVKAAERADNKARVRR